MQWHQLDHKQTVCTLLQTDNHTHHSIFTGRMLYLTPNQQCHSTEGIELKLNVNVNVEFKVTLHEQVRYRGTLQY